MSRKPTIDRAGVDILFSRPGSPTVETVRKDEKADVGKSESRNVVLPARAKEKEAFYLLPETLDTIEDLRRRLRRDHGISRRATSKSAIVDAAIAALARNPEVLAAWLRSFK